jgi:hypothetical protein
MTPQIKVAPYDGVHALFIHFRKAFDLVDHEILLTKLGSMGVNKSFWLWCQSFLTNRTQQVKSLDVLSRVEAVPAGVPQGVVIWVLSPLRYLTCTVLSRVSTATSKNQISWIILFIKSSLRVVNYSQQSPPCSFKNWRNSNREMIS